jgi:hypothetical protein
MSNVNVVTCASHNLPLVSSVGVAVAVWEYRDSDARLVTPRNGLLVSTVKSTLRAALRTVRDLSAGPAGAMKLSGAVRHHVSVPVNRTAVLVLAGAGS